MTRHALFAWASLALCSACSSEPEAQSPPAAPAAPARTVTTPVAAAPTGGFDVAGTCSTLCAKGVELGCSMPAETCRAHCAEMAGMLDCQGETRRFLRCASAMPTASFACGDEGEATLNDGLCGAELEALATCVSHVAS